MSQQDRSERRAFVLANHPDRGGDPVAFIAGLRLLDQQQHTVTESPLVHTYRSRRTAPARWVRRLLSGQRTGQRSLR